MKKYINIKNVSLVLFVLMFALSNIIFVGGIGRGNYYEYSSGGFMPTQNNENFCNTYTSVKCENFYNGTLNLILRPLSSFFKQMDIRVLGTAYFFIVFIAFWLLLRNLKIKTKMHKYLFSALCLFVFGDLAYLLHFNTMSSQGAFLCALLTMSAIIILQIFNKTTILNTVIYCTLALFVSGLSEGWFLIGIFLIAMIFSTFIIRKDRLYVLSTSAIAVVTVGLIFSLYSGGVSKEIKRDNILNSTFYGILKDNPKNINDTGVDKELLRKYVGKGAFEIDKNVTIDFTYSDILKYYVKNPKLFVNKLEIGGNNAFEIRPQYESNYQNGKLKKGLSLYSAIKRRLFPANLWFILVIIFGASIFSAFNIKKEKNKNIKAHYVMMIFLSLCTLFSFVAPIIISGESQLQGSMFYFNIFFDLLLINIIFSGFMFAANRREKLKEKYGVNQ